MEPLTDWLNSVRNVLLVVVLAVTLMLPGLGGPLAAAALWAACM